MRAPVPRIEIVGGGMPDATEHAAIVEAVARTLADRSDHPGPPRSAWAHAGRLEAVGVATVRSRSALPR